MNNGIYNELISKIKKNKKKLKKIKKADETIITKDLVQVLIL